MSVRNGFGRSAFIAALLMLASTGQASASNVIDGCDAYCKLTCGATETSCRQAEGVGSSQKCVLSGDLSCSTGQGPVRLYEGTDLDLAGFDIQCTASGGCTDGVRVEAANSKIYSSSTTAESVIRGAFFNGVNCQGKNYSMVTGIAFEESVFGIADCATVTKNVVRKSGRLFWGVNTGIKISGSAVVASGYVADNYIEDRTYGITTYYTAGSGGNQILRNAIHTTARGECGIYVDGLASPILTDNIILGTGLSTSSARKVICTPAGHQFGAYSRNHCDKDHPDCVPCQTRVINGDFVCEPQVAPYTASLVSVAQISIRNLGTLLGGSASSSGWNGAGHNGEVPEGVAGVVDLRNCFSSGANTTCEIYAPATGEVGSVSLAAEPSTSQYITTWSTFTTDVTGSVTFAGGLPLAPGPLDVVSMQITAGQNVKANLNPQPIICTGASLGDSGVCQGHQAVDGSPCIVEWVGSIGNTSSACVPFAYQNIGSVNVPAVTLSTGNATLAENHSCTQAAGEACHCGSQPYPNACASYQCGSNGFCVGDPTKACFPDTIELTGSTSPVTLVGVGCATGLGAIAADYGIGLPGPVSVVSVMEVEAVP